VAKTDNYLPVLDQFSMSWPVILNDYLAMRDQESETGGQKEILPGKVEFAISQLLAHVSNSALPPSEREV
jgi:hypothetical protein